MATNEVLHAIYLRAFATTRAGDPLIGVEHPKNEGGHHEQAANALGVNDGKGTTEPKSLTQFGAMLGSLTT